MCTPNATNACQCVLADGVERGVLTINRMIPGPSIQVRKHYTNSEQHKAGSPSNSRQCGARTTSRF